MTEDSDNLCLRNAGRFLMTYELGVGCSDGSIPAIKLATYRRRLNAGNEVSLCLISRCISYQHYVFPNVRSVHSNFYPLCSAASFGCCESSQCFIP